MLTKVFDYPSSDSVSCNFIEVNLERGIYTLELYGASGANSSHKDMSNVGGKGGYSRGDIYIKTIMKLYLYIGGTGNYSFRNSSVGGWNGGGNSTNCGGSGGGATDIRTIPGAWNNEASLDSRIIVAGGGGGSYQGSEWHSNGDDGGGKEGTSTSIIENVGTTGTFSTCYGAQNECTGGTSGVRGSKGAGASGTKEYYSGGGGGYYGGGAGQRASGGGSGYVGNLRNSYMKVGAHFGNGLIIISKRLPFISCKQYRSSKAFIYLISLAVS